MNRKLCPPKSDVVIILDDESYFPLKHDEMPGNDGFYLDNKKNTPFSVKYKTKKKFALKVMIWLAISERGHSDVHVKPSGLAINSRVYIDECIRTRLVPFINQLHKDDEILFWPNLASSHYSIATRACYKELGINFVPKEMNPPNVPQLWPIENFWGILKAEVYKGAWEAKSVAQLVNRIKKCIAEMDWTSVQAIMRTCKTNFRKAADKTPLVML